MADIYVYSAKCEDFANFGLVGALTPTSCVFEEEANGMSEITMEHPIDDWGRYTQLVTNNILMVEVPVRTTPEIDDEGGIVTQVEQAVVKDASTITKAQRTLYKKASGSRKIKVVPGGTEVTVVNRPDEGRYKVKCKYGTGWMPSDGLEITAVVTIADNSQSIESVQPAWTVKPQLFRIYKVEKDILGLTVSARHISYDLLYNLTTYKNTGETTCIDALAEIMDNCVAPHDFEAFTNLLNVRTGVNWTRTNPIDALLNPETGLTALYGASLVRDNWELYVLHDPGLNRGVTVEYGKNMTGIKYTESFEEVVTRIIPVGETKDGNDLLLEGDAPYVDSPHINDYPVVYAQELKCENCKVGTDGVTTAIAHARMKEQARAVFENGGDLPTVELSVDFINLGDTAEYAQFKNLERLFLWDYVLVRHKLHGIDVTSRIVSIKWNCMLDRMEAMEIGSVGKTLANSGITTWQIPTGFSGNKIANGTVGGSTLAADVISERHIQAGSISANKIQSHTITAEQLSADAIDANTVKTAALDAIIATIKELDADKITADTLTGVLAEFVVLTAGTAEFDRATVEHLVSKLFNLTGEAVMEDVFIRNLKVAYAQILDATIGNLVLQGKDENGEPAYYEIVVDKNGNVTAFPVSPSGEEIADGVYKDTKPILQTNMTVDEMNAVNIKATHMLVNRIDAASIDTDELFAREAFITKLKTVQIVGERSLQIIAEDQDKMSRWFKFDNESGLTIRKPEWTDANGTTHKAAVWSTVTDYDGYHVRRDDLLEPVFSATGNGVHAPSMQVGNIIMTNMDDELVWIKAD